MIIATFLENILYARIIKGGGCRGPPPPENIFLKLPYIKENRFLSLPPHNFLGPCKKSGNEIL